MDPLLFIFSDASFHPQRQIGVGCYLILWASDPSSLHPPLKPDMQLFSVKEVNNIRMELATVITAMKAVSSLETAGKIAPTIYTDSEAICRLEARRGALESRQFRSLKTGELLANADLYKAFYEHCDRLVPNFIWLKGHQAKHTRINVEEIFSMVDRTARKRLRELIQS